MKDGKWALYVKVSDVDVFVDAVKQQIKDKAFSVKGYTMSKAKYPEDYMLLVSDVLALLDSERVLDEC